MSGTIINNKEDVLPTVRSELEENFGLRDLVESGKNSMSVIRSLSIYLMGSGENGKNYLLEPLVEVNDVVEYEGATHYDFGNPQFGDWKATIPVRLYKKRFN
jgi:hypothetical protein